MAVAGNGFNFTKKMKIKAIIAEKPSVGMDIARVVGATEKMDGYCTGNGYMVTWALGHLVQLALPGTYGYTKTTAADLPMLPDPFRACFQTDPHGQGHGDRPDRFPAVENHRGGILQMREHHCGNRCRTRG